MSHDYGMRDLAVTCFRDSKKLEAKGKLEEALGVMDRVIVEASNIHTMLGMKVVTRIGSLCNKLATSSEAKAQHLRRASDSTRICIFTLVLK